MIIFNLGVQQFTASTLIRTTSFHQCFHHFFSNTKPIQPPQSRIIIITKIMISTTPSFIILFVIMFTITFTPVALAQSSSSNNNNATFELAPASVMQDGFNKQLYGTDPTRFSSSSSSSSTRKWFSICANSWLTDNADEFSKQLCGSWGFDPTRGYLSNTSVGSQYTNSNYYGFACNQTSTGSSTKTMSFDLDKCSFDSFRTCETPSWTTSGRYQQVVQVRCYSAPFPMQHYAVRGNFLGSITTSTSLPTTTYPAADFFLRQLPSKQLQLRKPFTTEWKNIYSKQNDYNAFSATALAYFLGRTRYGYEQAFMIRLNTVSHQPSPTVPSSTFYMFDLVCDRKTPLIMTGYCSFSTTGPVSSSSSSSTVSVMDAIGIDILFNSTLSDQSIGLPLALSTSDVFFSKSTPRIKLDYYSSSRLAPVLLAPKESAISENGNEKTLTVDDFDEGTICPYGLIDQITEDKFCQFLQYGPRARGSISTSTRQGIDFTRRYKSIQCSSYAKSINDCNVQYLSKYEICPRVSSSSSSRLVLSCNLYSSGSKIPTSPGPPAPGSYYHFPASIPKVALFTILTPTVIGVVSIASGLILYFYIRYKQQRIRGAEGDGDRHKMFNYENRRAQETEMQQAFHQSPRS